MHLTKCLTIGSFANYVTTTSTACYQLDHILPLKQNAEGSGGWLWVISDPSAVRSPARHRPGPLLFLIFINDISANLSSTIRLFVHHCLLYREVQTTIDCNALQAGLNKLITWSYNWGMEFDAAKMQHSHSNRQSETPCEVMLQDGKRSGQVSQLHAIPGGNSQLQAHLEWSSRWNHQLCKSCQSNPFLVGWYWWYCTIH